MGKAPLLQTARFLLFVGFSVLAGCAITDPQPPEVIAASERYNATRDVDSLELLSKTIEQGMSREQVESLVGEPDHVPVEGQAVYASNKRVPLGDTGLTGVVALILSYTDVEFVVRDTVQSISFKPIGE